MKNNGLLRKKADEVERAGVRGDTELVHASPKEVALLERVSGNKSRNRRTGKRQFYDVGGGDDRDSGRDLDTGGRTGIEAAVDAGEAETATTESTGGYTVGSVASAIASAIGSVAEKFGISGYLDESGGLTQKGTGSALGLMAGSTPVGAAIALGTSVLGPANEEQFGDAVAKGTADYATGRGTTTGLFGETVEIALGPGPIGGSHGGGYGGGDGSDNRGGAEIDLLPALKDDKGANYRVAPYKDNGLLASAPTAATAAAPAAPSPATGPGRYEVDQRTGRVVWVPDRRA